MPEVGDFVELRGRRWLVEAADPKGSDLAAIRLSCVSDDAQGESLEVLWDAEIGPQTLNDSGWQQIGRGAPDTAQVLAAHIRAVRWNTASAADRDLLQAPFRAGIRLDSYQLLPLRKALRLPRVNLLIADDVGLGKTIEAGLVLRELLLRRRIDLAVVTAPASMTAQWRDELESKFGLSFVIIDRERIAEIRRTRGFTYNPWRTGSRFIISHSLLADETYAAGLRDVLGDFRSRALFILDEAQRCPEARVTRFRASSRRRYVISQNGSSTGCSSPQRRTMVIPIPSRRSSKCSTRSALSAASRCGPGTWSQSWCAASRPICAVWDTPFRPAVSRPWCSMACPMMLPNSCSAGSWCGTVNCACDAFRSCPP